MLLRALIIIGFCGVSSAQAQEVKTGLTNESELGYVITGGNSESESTSIKQKSIYTWEKDILKFNGHYLQSSGQVQSDANPAESSTRTTAENWSAAARFERVLVPKTFNAYLSHGWRGDRFQNINEAHDSEIGGKYFWVSSETTQFFTSLGYRYTRELYISPLVEADRVGVGHINHPEFHYANLMAQIDYAHSKSLSLGFWVKFAPSLQDFSGDQRIDYSPYLTSVLTDMFSLKVAYESNYRSKVAAAGNANTDYKFTTSLLAKF